jgi:hypothetical protein
MVVTMHSSSPRHGYRSSNQQQQKRSRFLIPLSFLIWSAFLALVAFYIGVFVGMHAAASASTTASIKSDNPYTMAQMEQEIQRRVKVLVAKQLVKAGKEEELKPGGAAEKKAPTASIFGNQDQKRFPPTVAQHLVGAALVDKEEFLKQFDVGIAAPLGEETKSTQVYLLYQHKKALPKDEKLRSAIMNNRGDLPLLSVEDATQECESLNIVSTRPFSGLHQCMAIIGQYESLHIHRYMRNENNQAVNATKYNLTRAGRGMQASGMNDMQPPPGRAQEINWNQLITYFSTITEVKHELKVILQQLTGVPSYHQAKDNNVRPPVIVMVCNLGQSDLLINFVCNARAKGLDVSQIIVFCTDTETLDIAKGLGLYAFYDARNFASVPSEEADTYGDPVFADVMFIKVIAVHLVNQLGYEVLFQDVDIVWNEQPLPYFREQYNEFDIIFQDDGARSTRFAPYAGNTGFYYVRHNPRTRYLLTNLVYIGDQARRAASHQQAMTTIMSEHAMQFGLRVKTMSGDNHFAGGYHFHRNMTFMHAMVSKGGFQPIMFHMCWTHNRDNKLNFMEQMGMWQVLDVCTTGIKAHEQLQLTKSTSSNLLDACCAAEPIVKCHFSDKPSIIPCKDSPKIDVTGKPFW